MEPPTPASFLDQLKRRKVVDRAVPWIWGDEHAAVRRDPRFVRYVEGRGIARLWRELGPPPDCRAEGASFRCGLRNGTGG